MTDLGVILLMAVCILVLLGVIQFFAWLTTLQEEHGSLPRAAVHAIRRYTTVNDYAERPPVVMSREGDALIIDRPLSLQTDARQTPDRPMIPKPTPEQWLTLYQLMRRHGIKRDDAGAALRAAGLTLDNNTWSKAQPPADEPAHVTPIVGRPTDATFRGDPDYPYESPA